MPTTVPVIQDSVQLQTQTGRQRIQADPNAFGMQEARATAQLANNVDAVAQIADEKVDEFARAEALELDNELSRRVRDRLYGTESGYLSTQRGRNALDSRGQVEADLDAIALEVGERTRNPRARALYVQEARRRVADGLGQVATHAARENTSYQNEVSEARITESLDNAVAAYADPAAVAAQMDLARSEVMAISERLGWDESVRDSRIRQLQSDISSRVIVQLAMTDPEAAQDMYERVRPSLSAQEAGELRTTMRAAQREAEDSIIDEAWVHVSNGRRPPAELWARVPGRARIDIQNELRRRAEGGAGTGNQFAIDSLDVMDDAEFARVDLMAIRGSLGSSFQRMAARQRGLREGTQDQTVNQQQETFNALVGTAESALAPYGIDITITEGMEDDERRRAVAFRAALRRELDAFGGRPTAEEAQTLIGRAVVSLRGADVPANPRDGRTPGGLRVEGRRGRNERSAVAPTTEAVVPFDAIPASTRDALIASLRRRLPGRRMPTRGEIENAYAAVVAADPRSADELEQVYQRIIIGGGE